VVEGGFAAIMEGAGELLLSELTKARYSLVSNLTDGIRKSKKPIPQIDETHLRGLQSKPSSTKESSSHGRQNGNASGSDSESDSEEEVENSVDSLLTSLKPRLEARSNGQLR
jgi:hypothetical protein